MPTGFTPRSGRTGGRRERAWAPGDEGRSEGGAEVRVRQWLVASDEWLVSDARAEVRSEPLVTGRSALITYH